MKYIVLLTIIQLNYVSFSQNRNVIGVAMSDSQVLPLLKIILIDSNDHVIAGTTTDLDGDFKLSLDPNNISVKKIVAISPCYIHDTIRNFNLQSDTVKLSFKIDRLQCMTRSSKDCPNHDQNCEVYRACDILYHPYDHIEGEITNDLNQIIHVKIRKATYTQNGCCLNTWYCKTHNVDY